MLNRRWTNIFIVDLNVVVEKSLLHCDALIMTSMVLRLLCGWHCQVICSGGKKTSKIISSRFACIFIRIVVQLFAHFYHRRKTRHRSWTSKQKIKINKYETTTGLAPGMFFNGDCSYDDILMICHWNIVLQIQQTSIPTQPEWILTEKHIFLWVWHIVLVKIKFFGFVDWLSAKFWWIFWRYFII